MKMYLVYRIKDNGRFMHELIVGGLFNTLDEANINKKRGWMIKRILVQNGGKQA